MDNRSSYAEAVAITGDTFTAVGSNADVRRLAGRNTRQVDLKGLTVMPAMADNHLHGVGGGPVKLAATVVCEISERYCPVMNC